MKQNKLFFLTIVLTQDTDCNVNISIKSVQLRSYVIPNFTLPWKMSRKKINFKKQAKKHNIAYRSVVALKVSRTAVFIES